jgi:RNA polymerase sigma-70 factor (ECF subfamily)
MIYDGSGMIGRDAHRNVMWRPLRHLGVVNMAVAAEPQPTSDDLVRSVLGGRTELYAEIVRRHQREVWKVAVAILRDEVLSENMVQQTFINAYERLGQYRFGDLGRWLKAIARNLVKEELRRSSRESARMQHYRVYLAALSEDDDVADARDRRLEQAVAACRESLAPGAGRAMELHYDQALSLAEVAATIGRSITATRQLLFRARGAIRLCVERSLATE